MSPLIDGLVIVSPEEDLKSVRSLVDQQKWGKGIQVIVGGATRQDSVKKGLASLSPCDMVVIHDGVRPLVTEALISQVIVAASDVGAAVCGLPVKETIKQISKDHNMVIHTVDRSSLWGIQTPQAFRYDLLTRAFARAEQDQWVGTDEAMLIEHLGDPVRIVPGDPHNLKVTTEEDLIIAELWLKQHLPYG